MNKREKLIKQIARKTRYAMEKRVVKENILWSSKDTLEGMCAIASCNLFQRLKNRNIESRLHINEWHCFLTVDGKILDVTATQFKKLPKVLFCEKNDKILQKKYISRYSPSEAEFWKIGKTFTSIRGLQKFQIREGWDEAQIFKETIKG